MKKLLLSFLFFSSVFTVAAAEQQEMDGLALYEHSAEVEGMRSLLASWTVQDLERNLAPLNPTIVSAALKKMQLAALMNPHFDSRDLAHPHNLGARKVDLLKTHAMWFELSIKDILESRDVSYKAVPQMIAGNLTLNLAHCFLTSLEGLEFINYIDQVTHFRFGSNQIAELDADGFIRYTCVEKIDLGYNKITVIKAGTFVSLPNLKELYLGGNEITVIELNGMRDLPFLERLDYSTNFIPSTMLSVFKNFPFLKKLWLNHNNITVIPGSSFFGLEALGELSLHHNDITEIRSGSFAYLPQLKSLSLNDNRIASLTVTSFLSISNLVL